MGTHKLLLSLGEETVIQRLIHGLATLWITRTVIVARGGDEALAEHLAGEDVELVVVHCEPARATAGMGLFDTLAGILRESDPDGLPVPLLVVGGTDARQFARIGIDTYGFLPTLVPEEVARLSLSHAANERVPVSALYFGTDAIYKLLQRFGG